MAGTPSDDMRVATTHWHYFDAFARTYPQVHLKTRHLITAIEQCLSGARSHGRVKPRILVADDDVVAALAAQRLGEGGLGPRRAEAARSQIREARGAPLVGLLDGRLSHEVP